MKSNRDRLILLGILCLSFFLRVYDLGGESLWNDEAGSVRLSHMSCAGIIKNRAHDVHPPFYFLLLRYWVGFFGDSEFSVRFPSVLFGVGAVLMIYKLGYLLFDKEAGLCASLLLGVSTFHIRYSQEARAYNLMALLTLLSMYFLVRLFKERNHWVSIGYVISTALLVYTHYYGFFVLIAENLYAVTMFLLSKEDFKARIRKWLSLQFSIALLFGPWIRIFFKQVLRVQQKGEFCKSAALSPYTIYKTLYQYAGNTELLLLFFLFVFLSVLLHEEAKEMTSPKDHQVFLKGISQEATFGDANRVRGMYLLSLWLLAPILLPFAVSHFSPRFYTYKYTISASLALCLLVAKGISKIASKWLKWIAAALILVLSLVSARQYYVTVQKEEWREAAAYLDSNARSGDLALIHARFTEKAFNYYSRRADLIKKGFPSKTNLVDEKTIGELASTTKGYPRVWLILSHSRDRHGLIAKTLSKTYGLSDYEKFKGIELHLFKEKRWMKEGNAPWQGS